MRRWLAAALVLLALPSAALAGGPAPVLWGGGGVESPLGEWVYVTVPGANGYTVVERIRRVSGAVERTALLRGEFGVPSVAYDGSTTGVSADGFRLVLAGAFTHRSTKLLVLDTDRLRIRGRFTVPGFATVHAVSPTGRWIYLVRYRADWLRPVAVRAYDTERRRAVPVPGRLRGMPVSRVGSPDGRWAYTLYEPEPGGSATLHALDTATRHARVVALPRVHGDLFEDRLRFAGGALELVDGTRRVVARIDLTSFTVTRPRPPRAPAAPADGGGGFPWLVVAAGALLVVAVAGRRMGPPRASTSTRTT